LLEIDLSTAKEKADELITIHNAKAKVLNLCFCLCLDSLVLKAETNLQITILISKENIWSMVKCSKKYNRRLRWLGE